MAGPTTPSNSNAASQPTLVPQGPHLGKPAMPLGRAVTVVGSRHRAHLHLLSKSVSKSHALIVNSGGRLYVRDLASRARVIINGQPASEHDLRSGDLVQIGSFLFKFLEPSPAAPKPPAAPQAVLRVAGRDEAMPFLGKTLLIGRRATCDVALDEEAVSTTHAVIFEMAGQRYIRDLGSRTGTYVNGISIHQTPFNIGDRLKIGGVEMRCVGASVDASVLTLDEEDDAGSLTISEPAGESGLAFEPIEPAVSRAPQPKPQIEPPAKIAPPIIARSPAAEVEPISTPEPELHQPPVHEPVFAEPTAAPIVEDHAAPVPPQAFAEPTQAPEPVADIAIEPLEPAPTAEVWEPAEQPAVPPPAEAIALHASADHAEWLESPVEGLVVEPETEPAAEHHPEPQALPDSAPPIGEAEISTPAADVSAPEPAFLPEIEPTSGGTETPTPAEEPPIPLVDLPGEAAGEHDEPYAVAPPVETERSLPAVPSSLDLEFIPEPPEHEPAPANMFSSARPADPVTTEPIAEALAPAPSLPAAPDDIAAESFDAPTLSNETQEAHAPGLLEEASLKTELPATTEADDDDRELLDLDLDLPETDELAIVDDLSLEPLPESKPAADEPAQAEAVSPPVSQTPPAPAPIPERPPLPEHDWAAELDLGERKPESPLDLHLDEDDVAGSLSKSSAEPELDLSGFEIPAGKVGDADALDDDLDLSGLVVEDAASDIDERHLDLDDAPPSLAQKNGPAPAASPGEDDDLDLSLDLPPVNAGVSAENDLQLDNLPSLSGASESVSMSDLSLPDSMTAPRADDLFRGMSSDFSGLLGGLSLPPVPVPPPVQPRAVSEAPSSSAEPEPQQDDEFVMDEAGAALQRFEAQLAAVPPAAPAAPPAGEADNNDAYGDPTDGSLPLPPTELAPDPEEGIAAPVPSLTEPTVQSAATAIPVPKPPPRARLTGKGRRAQRQADATVSKEAGPASSFGAAAGWNNLMEGNASAAPTQTTTPFDGLAMPLPPTDVFWQMPAGADPIFGRPSSPASVNAGLSSPPGRDGPAAPRDESEVLEDEEMESARLADTDDTDVAEALQEDEPAAEPIAAKVATSPQTLPNRRGPVPAGRRPPNMLPAAASRAAEPARQPAPQPQETFRAPVRRKKLGVGTLLLMMALLMAAVAAAIYVLGYRLHYFAPRADVTGALPFQSLDTASAAEKTKLVVRQREILKSAALWAGAIQKARAMVPGIDPGFLGGGGAADALAGSAIADSAEIPSGRSAVLLKYRGQDPLGDQVRFLALLKSLYDLNRDMVDQSTKSTVAYDKARTELAKVKAGIENLQRERDSLSEKLDVDPALRQRDVRRLRDEGEQLWKRWSEATAAVQATQAQLEQVEAALPPPDPDKGAARASPAPPQDSQLAEMEQQLKDLSQSLAAKKESRMSQAETARKSLDQALSAFDKEIASARSSMKGESELTRYLATARRVQDAIRTAHEDLVYQQKEDYARLSELKRRLAEKNEARIKEAWADDADLRAMEQDQAIKERRYNAAAGSGLAADAQKIKAELSDLAKQVEARRSLLVSADVYAPEIRALQSFIDDNLKRMEEARTRNDQRMRELLAELTAGAPELASLPTEQKALAEQLEKRSGELNSAREKYAVAMSTATATTDAQIATLDGELTQIQAKLDARKKQIALAAQETLSAEQQRSRQQAASRLKAELAAAKQTESTARAEYAANQQQLTAREAEVASLETMRPRYHELAKKIGDLRLYQQEQEAGLVDLTKAKERDAALMPLPPGESSVIVTSTPDRRREVMIVAMALIALVFVGLMVRSHQQPPLPAATGADPVAGLDVPTSAGDAGMSQPIPQADPGQRRAIAV